MSVEAMKTQVMETREKIFGGEVTMTRKCLMVVVLVSVLTGMILGLCKGLKICTCKKDKECMNEECCK